MNFTIKSYEPDKNFEQFQAEIYNQAVDKYGGAKVSAEGILKRLKTHDPPQDTNGIFFAFNENNKPLAYIQYRIYDKDIFIGFPWATDDCPVDVQDQLFNKMMNYVKKNHPTNDTVYIGYIMNHFTDVIDYIKQKDFEFHNSIEIYSVNTEKISKLTFSDSSYSFREASLDDVEVLVNLALKSDLKTMGENNLRSYFSEKVLKDGNCVLLFKENMCVASTAIIQGFYDNKESLARYIAIHEDHLYTYKELLLYLSQYLSKKNNLLPIRINLNTKDQNDSVLNFIKMNSSLLAKESAFKKSI